MEQTFQSIQQALSQAKIPSRLKQTTSEFVIELGFNYPDELVDRIYEVLPDFKGSICADSSGGIVLNQAVIAGGPKRYF